jgi:hypothetical protein
MQLFVPIDDPVYDFLERQATRGYIPEFMNDSRPLQRDEVASWLLKIQGWQNKLHKVDRELLANFAAEYRHELTDDKHPALADTNDYRLGFSSWSNLKDDMRSLFSDKLIEEENHIYLMEDGNNTVWINADLSVTGEGKNTILRFYDQLGAEASMQIGDHLSMFVDGYFFHHYLPDGWRELADEFSGYWINDHEYDHLATFDRSEAYMNITGKFGTLSLAHYPIVWGNSLHSIILSDDALSFGSLRWTKQFKNFKYSFIHGTLMASDFEWSFDEGKYYVPKYMVGHNIEINFSPRFHVGFNEILLYGNRLPEPTYLIPSILLWPSEHALGDRDNKMISLSAEIFPLNGLRLYGTVLMDELVFGQIFNDFWANEYGLQGGFQWSPRSLPMDVVMEMTAVHPWTYAHKYEFTSYTHHGQDLGFFLGPNTQLITGRINYDLSPRHRISLEYNNFLDGADSVNIYGIDYPVGGNSNQNYEERSNYLDDKTTWLMGDIRATNSLKFEWLYRWRNQVEFLSTCELRNIDGHLDTYYSLKLHLRY